MIPSLRIDCLDLAKRLTGSSDVDELIAAATKLEGHLTLSVGSSFPLSFTEFMKQTTIRTPTHGTVRFNAFPFQEKIIEQLDGVDPRVLIKSSRQTGISTIAANFVLWYAMRFPHQSILIIANQFYRSMEQMDIVEHTYNNLACARPLLTSKSKSHIQFANGSEIRCAAASNHASRGLNLDLIVIDELAYIAHSKEDEFWQSIAPQLATGCRLLAYSTPSGSTGLFNKLWTDPESPFLKLSTTWRDHPMRDDAWADMTRNQIGEAHFRCEYEGEFVDRPPYVRPTAP